MTDVTALGKLNTAIARLLHKYPLLGGLLATWTTVEDASVDTMAVGMGPDGIILFYAPAFVKSVTVEGLIAVLHHEVRHVVYGHVFLNPDDFADHEALTIAEEVTVNENLPEKLPIRGILLEDYPRLKPNQDTASRYHILAKQNTKQPKSSSRGQGQTSGRESNGGSNGAGKAQNAQPGNDPGNAGDTAATGGQGKTENSNDDNGTDGSDAAQNPPPDTGARGGHQDSAPDGSAGVGQPPDNHDRWASFKKDESFARATIEATLHDLIAQGVSPTEYEQKIFEETIKSCGGGPGNGFGVIRPSDHKSKKWQSLLRCYIGNERQSVSCYQRPARRFPDLVGIVPGRYSTTDKPKVMTAFDTSGSMSDVDLAEISRELHAMSAHYEIHVVEFDDIVHRDYKYKGAIKTVLGRGGTTFIPLFERDLLSKIKPDLIAVFTDGYGDAPEKQPKIPVIWVLTRGGVSPVNWGRVIKMDEGKEVERE